MERNHKNVTGKMSIKELFHAKLLHSTENYPSYQWWLSAHILGTLLNRIHHSSPCGIHVSSLEDFHLGICEGH